MKGSRIRENWGPEKRKAKMSRRTHFVIYKGDESHYSIREYGNDVKQAFMDEGIVSGDGSVLLKLSRVIPDDISVRNYLERNANHVIFCD